jgi:hypothetical protein
MIGNNRSPDLPGSGFRSIHKFGENTDIDVASVPETIWSHGGQFKFLDAGLEMDFKSTLADDAIAGTGAQKLQITFYDGLNNESIQIFDTAGQTPVQLPGLVKMVTRIEVLQSGSGRTNAGEINVVDRATGAVVYQSLEPGEGQTLSCVQMIPAGKKGLLREATVSYAKLTNKNDAILTLRVRRANGTIVIKHRSTISSASPKNGKTYRTGGVDLYAGDVVYWQCDEVSGNDTPIYATFDIEIENL